MFNKKGLTLIEVIVSIALIGIIAVMFLPSLSKHFKWIVDTKTNITQSAFDSQLEIENNTKIVKEFINDLDDNKDIDPIEFVSMGISKKTNDVKLFEREYSKTKYPYREYPNGYLLESNLNEKRKFISFVGDKRLPELEVPQIKGETLFFLKEGVEANGNFEYANYPDLKIKSVSNMSENPGNSFNRYRHDWYVSKPGFLIPVPDVASIDEDFDMGRIYPSFPEGYNTLPIFSELGSSYIYKSSTERLIDGVLANVKITNNDKYVGRHFGYTITPFAKSLKIGKVSTILPLYIYGPKNSEGLVVHLDASVIDLQDIPGTIVKDMENLNLKSWHNTRPFLKSPNTANNAIQTAKKFMPVLKTTNISEKITPEIPFQGKDDTASVWGRSLASKAEQVSNMKISNIILNEKFNIFMVMRKVDDPRSPILNQEILSGKKTIGKETWSLSWINDINSNPVLSFKVNDLDPLVPSEFSPVTLPQTLNLNEWHLIEISKDYSRIKLRANNLTMKKDNSFLSEGYSDLLNSSSIDINWNGVEIAELLIYNRDIDSIQTTDYLIKKYKGLE